VIGGIDRLGFRCADICDVLKGPNGSALQVDMLFVKPALLEKYRLAAGLN
jgi:hypothetical protein